MKKDKNDYSEDYVRKHRTFPVKNTVLLVICLLAQALLVLFAVTYEPYPQDRIKNYIVDVEPLDDGSLDIQYTVLWEALDTSEELTWIDIGMANKSFSVYPDSLSDNIKDYTKTVDGDYVALTLDLDRAYIGGETLQFSFKINVKNMLCRNGAEYFYEFVPGWFNYTPIDRYMFRWKAETGLTSAENGTKHGDWYIWTGALPCGGYDMMYVTYSPDRFAEGTETVTYSPFNDSEAYDGLWEDRAGLIAFAVIVILVLVVVEVYIVDSYVSYDRGRGFLTGYGYRVHVYGRTNPHYIRERNKHSSRGSGGGGGGCACACACACAGGGRAGCSQKDTFGTAGAVERRVVK